MAEGDGEVSDGVKRKTPPAIILFSELPEWQATHQSSTQGLFWTVCRYSTDDPYVRSVISDFYMDFDCEENPDKARREAVAVIKKLIEDYNIPEGTVTIAFSGMKGVTVTVARKVFSAESLDYLPLVWKNIVLELATKLKLKNVEKSIYERR